MMGHLPAPSSRFFHSIDLHFRVEKNGARLHRAVEPYFFFYSSRHFWTPAPGVVDAQVAGRPAAADGGRDGPQRRRRPHRRRIRLPQPLAAAAAIGAPRRCRHLLVSRVHRPAAHPPRPPPRHRYAPSCCLAFFLLLVFFRQGVRGPPEGSTAPREECTRLSMGAHEQCFFCHAPPPETEGVHGPPEGSTAPLDDSMVVTRFRF